MSNMKDIMNQAVADLSTFASIIHQIHWYMRGSKFLTMHPKMDDFMDEINEQLDEVAERLIIVGGAPYSTLQEFSQNSKLSEEKGDFGVSIKKHLERLLEGYQYLSDLYQKGIEAAEAEGDAVSADMFTSLKAPIEKNIWMITASLA